MKIYIIACTERVYCMYYVYIVTKYVELNPATSMMRIQCDAGITVLEMEDLLMLLITTIVVFNLFYPKISIN